MAKRYEIVPNPRRGGWDVRADSGRRLASNHSTMAAALESARRYVNNAGGGVVLVRELDGVVRMFDSNSTDATEPGLAVSPSTAT
jgi:hypothetical protein